MTLDIASGNLLFSWNSIHSSQLLCIPATAIVIVVIRIVKIWMVAIIEVVAEVKDILFIILLVFIIYIDLYHNFLVFPIQQT